MSDLAQLIEDLESAQVGSLHYDKRILAALGFTWRGMAYWNGQEQWKGSAALTRSMDAAVALIERKLPGWCFEIRRGRVNTCTLYEPDDPAAFITDPWPRKHEAAGRTLALAACSSFLRALQAQQETLNAPR